MTTINLRIANIADNISDGKIMKNWKIDQMNALLTQHKICKNLSNTTKSQENKTRLYHCTAVFQT